MSQSMRNRNLRAVGRQSRREVLRTLALELPMTVVMGLVARAAGDAQRSAAPDAARVAHAPQRARVSAKVRRRRIDRQ